MSVTDAERKAATLEADAELQRLFDERARWTGAMNSASSAMRHFSAQAEVLNDIVRELSYGDETTPELEAAYTLAKYLNDQFAAARDAAYEAEDDVAHLNAVIEALSRYGSGDYARVRLAADEQDVPF
jgi:hypothetical protein